MAEQWILDLTKELRRPHDPLDQELYAKSIYRVPKILTDVNSQAYEPKLASFGPYHHDCLHLRPMEQHKHRALIQFLRRIAKSSKTPEDVLVAMRNVEPRLLASYDSLCMEYEEQDCLERSRIRHRDWCKEKDEFLKLMIVDGCFALEVMLAEKRSAAAEQSEYDSHDSVFGVGRKNYVIPDLKRDMFLLENQIPFLALTTLAAIDTYQIGDVSTLIKTFYNVSSASPDFGLTDEGFKGPTERSFHILDLYRKILTGEGEYLPSYEENVQSATELRNAGVSFCKSKTKSFRDISFNGGILSLPPLEIDDTTESLMLNLMAFERLHATAGNEVTAYAFFMDGLINTADDVALLRTEEIIMGWVGCDGNIANMFNRITKEATLVVFRDDIQVDVNRRLNHYCKKRMHRWRASFVETYLKNPWVFTSLLGGLFLLALTIVQTVYAMLQFYEA
ncbi:UPF0481 protein At3g47200-like isoform X2 [Phalaenopsis equestris]|uniref:UPF0481 protein At3g47200-like isoform X2 n=1 Tax=Phalaenopsis equestris TaxID=78828 RepID=UPI0009E584D9|nr:UPF0481 protein At3g47200-like isoform X2 [Phalaenopsis equestris]